MRRRLSAALRLPGPTLVYAVERIAEALAVIEEAVGEPIDAIDAVDAAALAETLAERRGTTRAVVLILEERISDQTREVLTELRDEVRDVRVIALSQARAPSEEMWSLFPLRMAAVRAFEEVH